MLHPVTEVVLLIMCRWQPVSWLHHTCWKSTWITISFVCLLFPIPHPATPHPSTTCPSWHLWPNPPTPSPCVNLCCPSPSGLPTYTIPMTVLQWVTCPRPASSASSFIWPDGYTHPSSLFIDSFHISCVDSKKQLGWPLISEHLWLYVSNYVYVSKHACSGMSDYDGEEKLQGDCPASFMTLIFHDFPFDP